MTLKGSLIFLIDEYQSAYNYNLHIKVNCSERAPLYNKSLSIKGSLIFPIDEYRSAYNYNLHIKGTFSSSIQYPLYIGLTVLVLISYYILHWIYIFLKHLSYLKKQPWCFSCFMIHKLEHVLVLTLSNSITTGSHG